MSIADQLTSSAHTIKDMRDAINIVLSELGEGTSISPAISSVPIGDGTTGKVDISWVTDAADDLIAPRDIEASRNLTVTGGTGSYLRSLAEEADFTPSFLNINYGESGAGVTAGTAGIRIERGSEPPAWLLYDETASTLKFDPGTGVFQTLTTDGAGSTVDADTVDSYHAGAHDSLIANEIVTRDGTGEIHTNYLNMSANDIATVVPSRVAVETSTDTKIRWQTWTNLIANIKTGVESDFLETIAKDQDLYLSTGSQGLEATAGAVRGSVKTLGVNSGYAGYGIDNKISFIHDTVDTWGIWDQINARWIVKGIQDATDGNYIDIFADESDPEAVAIRMNPVDKKVTIQKGDFEIDGNLVVTGNVASTRPPELSVTRTQSNNTHTHDSYQTCFMLNDAGELFVTGSNSEGVMGMDMVMGDVIDNATPIRVPFGERNVVIEQFANIGTTAMALDSNNQVWSWGFGGEFRGGWGDTSRRTFPTKLDTVDNLPGLGTWSGNPISINYGYRRSGWPQAGVITDNGTMYLWGRNNYGQGGFGTTTDVMFPSKVDPPSAGGTWVSFKSDGETTYALSSDGTLYASGRNDNGSCSVGHNSHISTFTQMQRIGDNAILGSVTTGAVIKYDVCADESTANGIILTDTGEVYSVGRTDGTATHGNGVNVHLNLAFQALDNTSGAIDYVSLAGENRNIIVLTSSNTLIGWGRNNHGQLGQGHQSAITTPSSLSTPTTPVKLFGNGPCSVNGQCFYEDTTGDWYAAGNDDYGACGVGQYISGAMVTTWTKVVMPEQFVDVYRGKNSVGTAENTANFFLSESGRLYACGENNNGELGIGTANSVGVPCYVKMPYI